MKHIRDDCNEVALAEPRELEELARLRGIDCFFSRMGMEHIFDHDRGC